MNTGLRVLIVDDNPDDRCLAARALAAEFGGIELIEVIDAESLAKALELGSFDAVITDYRLRWTTGLDVLREVKERFPAVPVVMFTGTGTENIAVAAMKSGLDDYVVKTPSHFARLPMAVKTSLERQRGKVAEIELGEAEDRFRALIENAIDVVAVVAADSTITYASPSVQSALGWSADELVGRSVGEFVAEETLKRVREDIRALVEVPGQTRDFSYQVRHKDGPWRQLEGTARSLLDNPSVRGIVVNARDVTERNRLAEQLQITERMDAVGRLAGGVAHDLNNLLTVISGSATFLLEDLPDDNQLRDDAAQIKTASDRATSLIAQLLDFGRRKPGTPSLLDLNGVIVDFEPMLRKLLGEGVVLLINLDPALDKVEADRVQLEQVIVNLIVNARDATSHKGTVTIETGGMVLTEHKPTLGLSPGRYVCLSVSDDGVGMPPEVRERVFEPFFTTKEGTGTGLGLASAFGIVAHGGGTITAESEPGKGATFRVFVPSAA
jgi:two-component system, cell cycle sensor histidine kinase and response regulator CckA